MMQTTRLQGTVRIRLPATAGTVHGVTLDGVPEPTGIPRGDRRSSTATGHAAGSDELLRNADSAQEIDVMLQALADRDSPLSHPMEVVDRFSVNVGPGSTRNSVRGGSGNEADEQELDLEVDLLPGESGVVLIEQEGTYEWHYPTRREQTGPRRSRFTQRREAGAEVATVSFRIPIGSTGTLPVPIGDTRGHRGPITSFIRGRIRAFILKFVATTAIGALTRRMERGVDEGPVVITSAIDASQWTRRSEFPTSRLTQERSRRVLLLIHGTFSSTLGSFGALTAHAEGQSMLEHALARYDLVVGFDHYTLSETPKQNAEAILSALLPLLNGNQALEIDAISFSRGGLVYRYLSEILVPDTDVAIVFRKAVFVGCTNRGTELANDENWKHLVDFYTNMIAGATRLIGLAPGAALPASILRQGVKVIGSLVTYMAQDGVSGNSVPGVAAMEPNGDFVVALNELPSGRASPGARAYYAIGSNFEPADSDNAFRLGKNLVLKVADGFVDELMGRANDLVVNNDSMFVIDPIPGARMVEKRSVEANGSIYHTVYFHQAMVASSCARWLGIAPSESTVEGVSAVRASWINQSLTRNWWADAVTEDLLLLPCTSSVAEAFKRIESEPTIAIVLQRLTGGERQFLGFSSVALREAIAGASDRHASLDDALHLGQWQNRQLTLEQAVQTGSASALRGRVLLLGRDPGSSGGELGVIVDAGNAVGVVLATAPLSPTALETALPRAHSVTPTSDRRTGNIRRTTNGPQLERAPSARTAANPEIEPESVWCHMHANMAEEVPVDAVASLEVTVSRDLIARESGISGAGEFIAERPLIIQVVARRNCDIAGSGRVEIDVPGPGIEVPVFFDIEALHVGMGELDVFARQDNQAIIFLKLRPRFIERSRSPAPTNISVVGDLQPAAPRQHLADVLYIHDVQIGSQRLLEFNLQARSLGIQGRYRSDPFQSEENRSAYIGNLYREIEEFRAQTPDDYEAFMDQLMARGANLFDTLLPEEVQALLWEARDMIKGIQVYSDEPFIPWELMYLKPPGQPASSEGCFLVEKGMFRWIANTRYAPTEIRLRAHAFKHVVPSYPNASGYALAGAQLEREMLETKHGAALVAATLKAVKDVLRDSEGNDILHFACHGLAESDSIWNSGLLMEGRMNGGDYVREELSYEWTSMFANQHSREASGPLIFLNACQTGRSGYNLTGTGGFAQAFVMAGASAFIGSHWSVGDSPALQFSDTFYDELLSNGSTMMEAVAAAREAAKNNREVTWLAYAVYADPYARIVKQ